MWFMTDVPCNIPWAVLSGLAEPAVLRGLQVLQAAVQY